MQGRVTRLIIAALVLLAPLGPAQTARVPVVASTIPIDSLALAPSTLRSLWGASFDLKLTAKDAKGGTIGSPAVVFVSSAPDVVRVDASGRITLLRRGHADITASGNGRTATTKVEVEGFAKLGRTSGETNCALPDDRQQIYCWGDAYWKIPLGRAPVAALAAPSRIAMGGIPPGTKIATISIGVFSSCALSDDGHVYCWGQAPQGALGRLLAPPAAAGASSEAPAEIDRGEVPAGVKFTAVGVGANYACAAGDNHLLYCWGAGGSLPARAAPPSNAPVPTPVVVRRGEMPAGAVVTRLALSVNGGCALADGEVFCWRTGNPKGPVRVTNGEHDSGAFVDVDSDDFTCALTSVGAAYCTGTAQGPRFGAGSDAFLQAVDWRAVSRPGAIAFKVISEGGVAASTCAIDEGGALWCWSNAYLGSAADGNLVKHTLSTPSPAQRGEIPEGTTLVDLSCGEYACIALGSDGRHYGWGSNEKSVLGRDVPGGSAVPLLGRAPVQ